MVYVTNVRSLEKQAPKSYKKPDVLTKEPEQKKRGRPKKNDGKKEPV